MNKKYLLMTSLIAGLTLAGCRENEDNLNKISDDWGIVPDLEYSGDLDIFCYIVGQEGMVRDIGRDRDPSELWDSSLAKYHAVAKAWKEFYPNIKINVIYGGIEDYNQRVLNYQNQYGHLPHLMHLPTAPQEGLNKGYNVDLSQYSYMSYYKAINPSLLNYFTFGGFVSAVPMYVYPTGVFVNLDTLEKQYIDTENILDSWTFETMVEYARSTTSPENAGTGYISNDMLNNAVKSINYSLLNEGKVDFNTTEIRELLELENQLYEFSSYDWKTGTSKAGYEFIQPYSYNTNFIDDSVYTMESSRSFCNLLYSQMIVNNDEVGKFDFLPIPRANEDSDLSIGIIAEGLVVGNQCPIQNEECSENSKLAQEAAAAFAMFANVDTRAYEELSKVEWEYQGKVVVGNVESLPVIRNDYRFNYNTSEQTDYEIQLDIYKSLRTAWANQKGFNEILRIFEEEPENCYAYNTIPRTIPDGSTGTKDIMREWDRRYYGDGTVTLGDTGWTGWVESNLIVWTNQVNKNIATCYDLLQENIDSYYGSGKYDVDNNQRLFEWETEI